MKISFFIFSIFNVYANIAIILTNKTESKNKTVTKNGLFRFIIMKVVDPNNTNHTINLIPRFYDVLVDLELYNEATRENNIVANTSSFIDGIFSINFDFDFSENDKFQIKISKDSEILYRGKLIATTQEPQEYKLTKDLYYYE